MGQSLKTIRLICRCGGVFEASLQAMEEKGGNFGCPLCGKSLHPPKHGEGNPLIYLFMGMLAVSKAKNVVVEFVLSDCDEPGT